MTLKTTNAATAKALRELARDYEEGAEGSFTCTNVDNALGAGVRRAYEATFGFGALGHRGENDEELWEMEHPDITDTRILLLCFAAAMAETGDL